MITSILKILYLLLVLVIIYDTFGKLVKEYLKIYRNIKRSENNLKDTHYFRYLTYSRTYPLWIALKQWRILYPITLFILPVVFMHLLGQNNIKDTNSLVTNNIFWLSIPFVLIAIYQIFLGENKHERTRNANHLSER